MVDSGGNNDAGEDDDDDEEEDEAGKEERVGATAESLASLRPSEEDAPMALTKVTLDRGFDADWSTEEVNENDRC